MIDWLMGIAGFERKAGDERGGDAEGPYTWPMWAEGRPDPTPSSLPGFARQGYNRNAIIYACISRKASSASMAVPVAYGGDRAEPERLPDDAPYSMLLRRPNRWMSWYEMQELALTYLDLDGNAFFYKAKPAPNRPPSGLFPLRPDRVRPVPKAGELLGYVYDGGDRGAFEARTPFLPDEIIHVKYPNPLDPFEGLGRGLSPLAAAALDVDLDNQNVTFLGAFFRNAAVPFGLLKTKQKLLDGEVGRIRDRVRSQYAGSRNWHDIMILDADADYQRLGLDMKELEFDALDSRNEARMCAALGVPPIIAGARVGLMFGTFSNYREARTSFWEDTLVPTYGRFDDAFNLSMEDEFKGQWMAYDFSKVPALQANETELHERAVKAWTTGLATRDEARAMVSLPPSAMDGYIGDFATRPELTVAPMWRQEPGEEEGEEEDKAGTGGAEGKPAVQLDPDDDEAEEEARMQTERHAEESILSALERQRRELIGDDPDAIVSAEAVASQVEATSSPVRDALRRMLIESVDLGVWVGVEQLAGVGYGFDWTMANTVARAWANQYTGELITLINETTRRQVQQAVAAWIENGDPLQALVDELSLTFGRSRAQLVASTEVTNAYAAGQMEAYRASGVIERLEWRTARDELVCPLCGPLHGQQAAIGEEFAPGVVRPARHPRCRCWLVPVVD